MLKTRSQPFPVSLLLRDLFDRGVAGFGIEQHGFMRLEHFFDAGDVRQLRWGAAVVEGAEMFVAGQAFAHFENLDVAILQFPNLALGKDQDSAFTVQFHIYGFQAKPANQR
jgi:hypothetical protein